jgi:thiol-disulfide isomerase/thioredoxin
MSMTADLFDEGELPAFDGAVGWLNSAPLTPASLRGRPVLVNFWTYTCINWLRQLPYVRAWAGKYRDHGLVVVGVHTPEFGFERDPDNVQRAVRDMAIDYPVAIDSDYAVWRAFRNQYWPALYFADGHGRIRHHHFGEGEYALSELVIQRLLADEGGGPADRTLVSVQPDGAEAAADWADLRSPETYVGYARASNFASPGGASLGEPHRYRYPDHLGVNDWALAGGWTLGEHAAAADEANSQIAYRFHARDLHLIMGPTNRSAPVRCRVRVDGQPPGAAHGGDVDEQGNGIIAQPRMYQLIRQPTPIVDRQFEIEFLDPAVEVFAFTFG